MMVTDRKPARTGLLSYRKLGDEYQSMGDEDKVNGPLKGVGSSDKE